MHADGHRKVVVGVLSKDMATTGDTSRQETKARHYKNGVSIHPPLSSMELNVS